MATLNVIFRPHKANKQGLAPVVIELYDDLTRKKTQKSTGVKIEPKYWDNERRRVRRNHPNSSRMNALISQKLTELEKPLLDLEAGRLNLEEESIDSKYSDGSDRNYFEYSMMLRRKYEAEKKMATARIARLSDQRLMEFLQYLKGIKIQGHTELDRQRRSWAKKSTLVFRDITLMFLEDYESFLRNVKKRKTNTIAGSMRRIRRVFSYTIKMKKLHREISPFPDYQIKSTKGKREFLDLETLNRLEKLKGITKKMSLYRDMYLFSAFSGGLRWSDVSRLRWMDVWKGKLSLNMQKTKELVAYPIPQKGMAILDKYRVEGQKLTDMIFPVYPANFYALSEELALKHTRSKNDCANFALRKMARKLGLPHHMTFHTSRHTFATLAIEMGLQLPTLQKILGHSKYEMTERYLHISGKHLEAGMNTMDEGLKGIEFDSANNAKKARKNKANSKLVKESYKVLHSAFTRLSGAKQPISMVLGESDSSAGDRHHIFVDQASVSGLNLPDWEAEANRLNKGKYQFTIMPVPLPALKIMMSQNPHLSFGN